jgi:uncharacterized delta-60 repeat protein
MKRAMSCLMLIASFCQPSARAASGDLDTSFNGTGFLAVPNTDSSYLGTDVCVDGQGRIVAAAAHLLAPLGLSSQAGLVRVDATGMPDMGFGPWHDLGPLTPYYQLPTLNCADNSYGVTTTDSGAWPGGVMLTLISATSGASSATALGVNLVTAYSARVALAHPSANTWLVGSSYYDGFSLSAARLQQWTGSVQSPITSGTLFNGYVAPSAHYRAATPGTSTYVYAAGSANFYHGGVSGGVDYGALINAFNSNGTLRADFGQNGNVSLNTDGYDEFADRVVAAAGDKLYVGINAQQIGNPYVYSLNVVRLNSNGSIDNTFGVANIGYNLVGAKLGGLTVDAGGRVLIAGSRNNRAMVRRLTPTGTLDGSFGAGGEKLMSFGALGGARLHDLDLDSLGRIVLLGSRSSARGDPAGTAALIIARLVP